MNQLLISQVIQLVEQVACGEPEAVEETIHWLARQHRDLTELAGQLQAAIDAQAPVQLTYIDTRARITQGVIHPVRLEERWGQQYLIAFCESRQDERRFRLDRIITLEGT